MVKVEALSVTADTQEILKNLSFNLEAGYITCCIGKSGAGKTTLLRALAGLVTPSSGTIKINNMSLADCNAKTRAGMIGFVFQDFNLFAHMTVLQNCIDPLIIQGIPTAEATKLAMNILAQLGLKEKKDCYPQTLSGGQQQRIAIARALCLQPSVLLLDEPTASLDPENSTIIVGILQNLARQGLTIVLSTQDMNFARTISDRILFIQNGQIVEDCKDLNNCADCLNMRAFFQGCQLN